MDNPWILHKSLKKIAPSKGNAGQSPTVYDGHRGSLHVLT